VSELAPSQQPLLRYLTQPIYGYAGAIDHHFNFEVVRRLAEGPGNIVLVGPIVDLDPVVLPRRPNVHFTGELDPAVSEALARAFDVTIDPFAVEDEAPD
jgi:hypothetical protein